MLFLAEDAEVVIELMPGITDGYYHKVTWLFN